MATINYYLSTMDAREKITEPRPLKYPLYKPESAKVTPNYVRTIQDNISLRLLLENKLPSVKPVLKIISLFNASSENVINATHIPSSAIRSVTETIWNRYLNFSGVSNSTRGAIMAPLVEMIAKNEVSETNKPAGIMLRTFESQAQKPVFEEKGHESMTDSGGVHRNFKIITNCTNTNGEVLHSSIRRGLLGFMQNQEIWDPDNSDIATKLIPDIENKGWAHLSSNPGKVKSEEMSKLSPRKTIKDTSSDTNNKRLVLNSKKEFVLRPIDLKNGVGDILFRIFSNNNTAYTDIPASDLLSFSSEELESIVKSSYGFDKYKWAKVENIDTKDDRDNFPLFSLSITDSLPTIDSKIDKYMAVRGRSMHINIRDLGDKGRLFEIAGGHVVIDGADQNEYLSSYVHDFSFDNSIPNNFEWPLFMVLPEIPRVEPENEALSVLGLSDLVLIHRFDPKIEESLKRINKVLVEPKQRILKEIYERIFKPSENGKQYEKIERILLPKFSRSSLIQMIASTTIGKMMNCVFYDPQVYYRLGLAVDMPFPEAITEKILANIKSGKKIVFDESELSSINKSVQETVTELSLTRLGFPVLGGIKSLVGKYENYIRASAGFAYNALLNLTKLVGFVSDEGKKSKGEVFITAQNHQESTTSITYGLVNDMVTARINFEYPTYFETLDITENISEDILDSILQNEPNKESLKMEMKMMKQIWSLHKEDKNVDTLESVINSIKKSFPETKDEQLKALRFLIIASAYQNFEKLINTTSEFSEAYADILEGRK